MAENKFPVSFEYFKKYTYYEECIDYMFKLKANGNQQMYEALLSSEEAREKALKSYYEAFYLSPAIRKKYHIRVKPIPKKFMDNLLSIPAQDENVRNSDATRAGEITTKGSQIEDAVKDDINSKACVKGIKNNSIIDDHKGRVMLAAKDEREEVYIIADDDEPLTSPGSKSSISKNNEKSLASEVYQTKNIEHEEVASTSAIGKYVRKENPETSLDVQHNKVNLSPTSSTSKNTNFSFKNLIPYIHCCPLTFKEFRKYSNIKELAKEFCEEEKLNVITPRMIRERCYIIFYLAPEHRNIRPINKLLLLDGCPSHIKDKFFTIPTNLYLKEDNNRNKLENEEKDESGTQTERNMDASKEESINASGLVSEKTNANNSEEPIEILENRLLPPRTQQQLPGQSNKQSHQCPNTACAFHHITYFDFMKSTNGLSFLLDPQPKIDVIQNLFRRFVYNVLKHQNFGYEKYTVNLNLLRKFVKYTNICEICESDLKIADASSLDVTRTCSISDNERVSSVAYETVVERRVLNNENSTQSATKEATCVEEGANQNANIYKSSILNQEENVQTSSQALRIDEYRRKQNLVKCLRSDKTLSKFCLKLSTKLNESFDETVDFSSESYTIFFQCNEIPLKQIINDFCENIEDIALRIFSNKELIETLRRYYYFKYMTNENFAAKYPTKAKQIDLTANSNNVEENSIEKSNEKGEGTTDTMDREETKSKGLEAGNSLTLGHDKLRTSNNALEIAYRIFFLNTDQTHTLSYVLNTSFGFKQMILAFVLNITFEEFLELTNVYEGKELYEDRHIAKCMYRYVFHTPRVWPTNLYITLENLCKFLITKSIYFLDHSSMLFYISPKLLHWSNLLSCTNVLDCIKNDFERRTGKLLDHKSLKNECIKYYIGCWEHEKWLGGIPRVHAEFYTELLNVNSQGDAISVSIPAAPTNCNVASEIENNIELVNKQLVDEETTVEQMETAISPTTTIGPDSPLLSNAQGQVYTNLIMEEIVSNKPFENNNQNDVVILPTSREQEQTTFMEIDPCTSTTAKSVAARSRTHQTHITKQRIHTRASILPIRKAITSITKASNVTKNIATIKPLKDYDLVRLVPAHPPVGNNNNQVVQPVSDILSPASVTLSLAPTTTGSNSTTRCTQNSSNNN